MNAKFLLLLGVSGVGKSSIIKRLLQTDERFRYICPDVTRPLRCGEVDKREVSSIEMDKKQSHGEYLIVNELFGIRYATPRQPIVEALKSNFFPVLDWPVSRMNIMVENFSNCLYAVYISPPSIDTLKNRLSKDGRDADGARFASAENELKCYWSGEFDDFVDAHIISEDGEINEVANKVYELFILATK